MTEFGPENQKGTNHLCPKLKQTADISRHHHWFMSEERAQKYHSDDVF